MAIKDGAYTPNTSFSGVDMIVQFVFPGARPITIGTASTISYSSFREKRQVRTLSRISIKGTTKGPRTVSGSMIFTVINQHIVNDILESLQKSQANKLTTVPVYANYDKLKIDELPPFDMVITFANEYGQSAKLIVYGITIIDDGMVLSIEDIFTENQMTFIARDIELMKSTTGRLVAEEFKGSYVARNFDEPLGRFRIERIDSVESLNNLAKQQQEVWDRWSSPYTEPETNG